jgi:small GTP-binding protein
VGNEAVGKTSLIRYLVDNTPRNRDEPKTPRAAVREKIETRDWVPAGCPVTLHAWDFGGQEMMHGTHRFFLTERSLYLVVLEARREDDRSVYDWLKTVRTHGGESPVIVVVNKSDLKDHRLNLNESGLREAYPNIVAFVKTSCDPGNGPAESIKRLRALIAQTLMGDPRLGHVNDPMPRAYLRVKTELAALAREKKVLETREFDRLCETVPPDGDPADRITDDAERRGLLRLMHDLGVVVAHGLKEDASASLREVTLLDPNWLTGAIYTLLNHPVVRDQQGEFTSAQMADLLDPADYPQPRHEFILDMMQHPDLGLAFELPGRPRSRYLIPEALPKNQPDYGTWPADSLRFRYAYEFLPPGLVPRFIVQAHHNLSKLPTRWHSGVVLEVVHCPVLLRGDHDARRIEIEVAGPPGQRWLALNIVLNDLKQVHDRYGKEIGAKALVPVPDRPEVAVSYEHLLTLEQLESTGHKFLPEGADRKYTVRELLEGVRGERAPRQTTGRVRKPRGGVRQPPGDRFTIHAEEVHFTTGDDKRQGAFMAKSSKYAIGKTGDVGAIGDKATGTVNKQVVSSVTAYEEIKKLRKAAAAKAESEQELQDLQTITQAEQAAQRGDEGAARTLLGKVGAWVKDVGVEISAKAIAEWLKK